MLQDQMHVHIQSFNQVICGYLNGEDCIHEISFYNM